MVITIIYSAVFLVLFALGELMFHLLKVRSEITRKFVHIGTGLTCFTFPVFITTHFSVLFLTCSFALILIISIRFKFLKSINAVERITVGSYMFPITIYIMYISYSVFGHENYTGSNILWESPVSVMGVLKDKAAIYYFLPLLIFTLSDPLAALVGQRWPYGKYVILKETKTLAGSSAFFISSFALTYLFLSFHLETTGLIILVSFIMAVTTTVAEGVSQKGFDNLFVPVSALGVLILCLPLL